MTDTDLRDEDTEPRPAIPSILNQPNQVLRQAYAAFHASPAPRFLLHLFLPYPDNEYSVIVDTSPASPDSNDEQIIGHLFIEKGDNFPPAAAITFDYYGSTGIVAVYEDGTITVDYREDDTIPSPNDSTNIIDPEKWSDPGLLADAIDMIDLPSNPVWRNMPETPIRYYPGCAPVPS